MSTLRPVVPLVHLAHHRVPISLAGHRNTVPTEHATLVAGGSYAPTATSPLLNIIDLEKQDVMVHLCQSACAAAVNRVARSAHMCMYLHDLQWLVLTLFNPPQRGIKASRTFQSVRVTAYSSACLADFIYRYINGLEDKVERLEAFLKTVSV